MDPGNASNIVISSLASAADREAFREINEEWITTYFSLTDADREVLGDPEGAIVAGGGDVLVARLPDSPDVVGCVALKAYPGAMFELSKMGVRPTAQGRGVGQALIAGALARARQLGATRVFLGTNTALEPARHLYRRAGFTEITRDQLPLRDYYARADILMHIEY